MIDYICIRRGVVIIAKSKLVKVITKDGGVYQYNSVASAVDKSPFALWYILNNRKCHKYEEQMNKVKNVIVNDEVRYEV